VSSKNNRKRQGLREINTGGGIKTERKRKKGRKSALWRILGEY